MVLGSLQDENLIVLHACPTAIFQQRILNLGMHLSNAERHHVILELPWHQALHHVWDLVQVHERAHDQHPGLGQARVRVLGLGQQHVQQHVPKEGWAGGPKRLQVQEGGRGAVRGMHCTCSSKHSSHKVHLVCHKPWGYDQKWDKDGRIQFSVCC